MDTTPQEMSGSWVLLDGESTPTVGAPSVGTTLDETQNSGAAVDSPVIGPTLTIETEASQTYVQKAEEFMLSPSVKNVPHFAPGQETEVQDPTDNPRDSIEPQGISASPSDAIMNPPESLPSQNSLLVEGKEENEPVPEQEHNQERKVEDPTENPENSIESRAISISPSDAIMNPPEVMTLQGLPPVDGPVEIDNQSQAQSTPAPISDASDEKGDIQIGLKGALGSHELEKPSTSHKDTHPVKTPSDEANSPNQSPASYSPCVIAFTILLAIGITYYFGIRPRLTK